MNSLNPSDIIFFNPQEFAVDSSDEQVIDNFFDLIELGHLKEAADLFKTVIINLPENEDADNAYNALIEELVDDGQYDLAIEIFSMGREHELILDSEAYLKLSHVCAERRDRNLYETLFLEFSNIEIDEKVYRVFLGVASEWNQSEIVSSMYQALQEQVL